MSCILIPGHSVKTGTDPHIPILHAPVQSTPKIKSNKTTLEKNPEHKEESRALH
jgi:hypothetical protein